LETAGLLRTLVDLPLFPAAVWPLLGVFVVADERTEALRTDCWYRSANDVSEALLGELL
jgi:hypothetical protein